MKYEHVVNAVYNQPWAVLPSMYSTLLDLIAFRAAGNVLTEEEIQERIGAVAPRGQSRSGAVAVLPLGGVMSQRMNMMSAMSGGTSTELFGKMFNDAVNDPAISGIVMDIDSPGGSVFGVQELAQTIMDARGTKPIIAFANSMAASAAFWVAAAADEIVVTPGGQVGSIGVLTAHSDLSVALEAAGEKITLISAGKKKVDANPIEPLSPEAKVDLQATVDTYYASFVGAVARGRGVTPSAVRDGFGQGGMVGAVEAVKEKMADRIGTLETAISRAAGRGREGFAATSGFHQVGETTPKDWETTTSRSTDGTDGITWVQCSINAGQNLGRVLNDLIDERVTDNRSREDIIEEMAEAAGISPSTVRQILSGDINCPPIDRLEGFARVLRVPVKRLTDAAEEDGCDYSEGDSDGQEGRNDLDLRARRLELQELVG